MEGGIVAGVRHFVVMRTCVCVCMFITELFQVTQHTRACALAHKGKRIWGERVRVCPESVLRA